MAAAMVSVTIVAAAVSSLKRVYSDREERQAHLTLTSAAQLVRDEMVKTSVTKEIVVTNGGGSSGTATNVSTEGIFKSEMKAAVDSVDHNLPYSGSGIKLEVENLEMKPVELSFTMKSEEGEKYKVIFTFTMSDSKETLFLTMDGDSKTVENTSTDENGTTIKTTSTTITWSQPIINGIGGPA